MVKGSSTLSFLSWDRLWYQWKYFCVDSGALASSTVIPNWWFWFKEVAWCVVSASSTTLTQCFKPVFTMRFRSTYVFTILASPSVIDPTHEEFSTPAAWPIRYHARYKDHFCWWNGRRGTECVLPSFLMTHIPKGTEFFHVRCTSKKLLLLHIHYFLLLLRY